MSISPQKPTVADITPLRYEVCFSVQVEKTAVHSGPWYVKVHLSFLSHLLTLLYGALTLKCYNIDEDEEVKSDVFFTVLQYIHNTGKLIQVTVYRSHQIIINSQGRVCLLEILSIYCKKCDVNCN